MRAFKLILLSLLFTAFARGNAYVASISFHRDLSCKYVANDAKVLKHTEQVHKAFKGQVVNKKHRKYRKRGISIAVPCIAGKSLKKNFDFREFHIASVEDAYASFLYCVHSKRGPPAV